MKKVASKPKKPRWPLRGRDTRPSVVELFGNIKKSLPALQELLKRASSHWEYEDPWYRLYHQSFKVYALQAQTAQIVRTLQSLNPGRTLE